MYYMCHNISTSWLRYLVITVISGSGWFRLLLLTDYPHHSPYPHPIAHLIPHPEMALQKDIKAISICKALGAAPTKLTPKEFMMHYLTSDNADIAYLRRFWAQSTGLHSSVYLAEALGAELKRTAVGKQAWTNFIQKEVRCPFACIKF
jgi:hypothetical protein